MPSGKKVIVPTADEVLCIKAFLITKRNQTRDYLDVAALADLAGLGHAAKVLADMDVYYSDQARDGVAVSSQLARQLGMPRPKDSGTIPKLHGYKGLAARWVDWGESVTVCTSLAARMMIDRRTSG